MEERAREPSTRRRRRGGEGCPSPDPGARTNYRRDFQRGGRGGARSVTPPGRGSSRGSVKGRWGDTPYARGPFTAPKGKAKGKHLRGQWKSNASWDHGWPIGPTWAPEQSVAGGPWSRESPTPAVVPSLPAGATLTGMGGAPTDGEEDPWRVSLFSGVFEPSRTAFPSSCLYHPDCCPSGWGFCSGFFSLISEWGGVCNPWRGDGRGYARRGRARSGGQRSTAIWTLWTSPDHLPFASLWTLLETSLSTSIWASPSVDCHCTAGCWSNRCECGPTPVQRDREFLCRVPSLWCYTYQLCVLASRQPVIAVV